MIEALEAADPADEAWHWSSDHTVGASSGARPTRR